MICYKMRMLGSAIFIFFLCITGPLIPAVQQPAGGVTQAPELPVLPETVADFFRQPERAKELRHLELLLTVCKTTISYSLSRTVDQKDNPEEQGKISKHRYRLMILRDLINLSLGCCKYARDRNIGVGSFLLSLCEFYATYKIDFSKLTQRELSFHPIAELIELCSTGYATQSSVLSFEDYFKSQSADWLAIIARVYQRDQIAYKHLLASPFVLFFLYNILAVGPGKLDDRQKRSEFTDDVSTLRIVVPGETRLQRKKSALKKTTIEGDTAQPSNKRVGFSQENTVKIIKNVKSGNCCLYKEGEIRALPERKVPMRLV